MEYLLILNTFRIPRSSLDIQDGIYGSPFGLRYTKLTFCPRKRYNFRINHWRKYAFC